MALAEVGSPGFVSSGSESGTATIASAWGTGQTQAAGDYLVAEVTAGGYTSVGAITETSGTWALIDSVNVTHFSVATFGKVATGGDTAPTFQATFSGTTARASFCVETHQFTGQDAVNPVAVHGNNSGTSATSVTVTTTGNVPQAGCIGLSVAGEYYTTSSSKTVTVSSGWGSLTDNWNSGASGYSHAGWATQASPASGAALSCTTSWGTGTISNFGGVVVVIQPATTLAVALSDSGSGIGNLGVPAAKSSADTAHAAEAAYSFGGDWAHAAESASVASSGSPAALADSGSAADALAVRVSLPDTGTGAEALITQVPLAESGSSADALVVRVALGDSGAAGDALAVQASLPEAGSGAEALSVPASQPLGESGAGADAAVVSIPLGESGAGADAAAVGSPVPLSESGTGSEALAVRVPLGESGAGADGLSAPGAAPLAEAGTGADALLAAVPLAEAGSGADTVTSVSPVPLADSGAAAEALSVPAAQLLPESGSGAETFGAPGAQPLGESGAGSEALAVPAGSPLAEVGTGADALTVSQAGSPQLADSGTGAEALSSSAGSPLADAGTTADALVPGVTLPDAGSGADVLLPAAQIADSGSGADALLPAAGLADSGSGADSLLPAAQIAEAGTGTEALAVSGLSAVTLPDAGAAGDSLFVPVPVPLADAGSGAEALEIPLPVALPDSGAGGDSLHAGTGIQVTSADAVRVTESAFYYILSGDTASAVESASVTVLPVHVRSADTAHAADRSLSAWPARADSAKAVDRAASAWPAGDDAARAGEGWKPFRFSSADSAAALEVMHEMGIWTYIPVNVRLEGRFWRITGTDEHGNEVVILEGERLTRQVLELAERVSFSRVTRRVSSADCASSAEAVAREPVAVTCWVQPAAAVSVTVEAVPAPELAAL